MDCNGYRHHLPDCMTDILKRTQPHRTKEYSPRGYRYGRPRNIARSLIPAVSGNVAEMVQDGLMETRLTQVINRNSYTF